MAFFAIYQPSGRIEKVFSGPQDQLQYNYNPASGEAVLEVASGTSNETHYIDFVGGRPQNKHKTALSISADKSSILADGEEVITFSSIPNGVTASLDGLEYNPDESGVLELTVDMPGDYSIEFRGIPYLTKTLVFEGT